MTAKLTKADTIALWHVIDSYSVQIRVMPEIVMPDGSKFTPEQLAAERDRLLVAKRAPQGQRDSQRPTMTPEQILMYDLGKDALTYIQRSLVDLDPLTRASIAAEFAGGQPFEVRVRMWGNGTSPVFTVVQIGKDGEHPIHTTAEPR